MNCQEYQEWIQRRLDGERGVAAAIEEHRATCAACAALDEAAGRLEAGLRLLSAPVAPPERLADRIVFQVRSERRSARRRLLTYAAALAACLILGLYLGTRPRPQDAAPAPSPVEVQPEVASEQPKLNEQVGEASTAIATLVTRTADEAVGQGRRLLPEPVTPMATTVAEPLVQSLEPPAQSLYDAGQGVSAGLEPVTSSARRAVTLFIRDMSPVTQGLQ